MAREAYILSYDIFIKNEGIRSLYYFIFYIRIHADQNTRAKYE